MNKAQLIEQIAKIMKAQKSTVKDFLDAYKSVIFKTLKNGDTVGVTGFGTYLVQSRKKRKGINPATGKPMDIPAKKVPKFKPSQEFKEVVDLG
jgi:DNA-binding protein HU-beta